MEDYRVLKTFSNYKINKNGTIIHIESDLEVERRVFYHDNSVVCLLQHPEHMWFTYQLVAKLVAESFLENPENKQHIKFIDNCFGNINFDNLEWCDEIKTPENSDNED
jgi:hypothetical protein